MIAEDEQEKLLKEKDRLLENTKTHGQILIEIQQHLMVTTPPLL